MECTVTWTGASGARSGMGFVAETGSGHVVAMDGAPREIFSRVEELQALGLAAPDTVELLRRLNRHGMNLPLTAITVDECARAIFQALHGAEGK